MEQRQSLQPCGESGRISFGVGANERHSMAFTQSGAQTTRSGRKLLNIGDRGVSTPGKLMQEGEEMMPPSSAMQSTQADTARNRNFSVNFEVSPPVQFSPDRTPFKVSDTVQERKNSGQDALSLALKATERAFCSPESQRDANEKDFDM